MRGWDMSGIPLAGCIVNTCCRQNTRFDTIHIYAKANYYPSFDVLARTFPAYLADPRSISSMESFKVHWNSFSCLPTRAETTEHGDSDRDYQEMRKVTPRVQRTYHVDILAVGTSEHKRIVFIQNELTRLRGTCNSGEPGHHDLKLDQQMAQGV